MIGIESALRPHRRCGIDTAIFIYHIERTQPFDSAAGTVLEALTKTTFSGVTSVLTLTELLVKPLQAGRRGLAAHYEAWTRSIPSLTIVAIDAGVAKRAAALRANHSLRTIDALQIAAAIEHGATAFVTNDTRLRRVGEMEIVVLNDFGAS